MCDVENYCIVTEPSFHYKYLESGYRLKAAMLNGMWNLPACIQIVGLEDAVRGNKEQSFSI